MKNSSNRLIFPTFVCMEGSADKIFEVLKRYWGFTEFRPVQERIIRSAMAGRDTLALMPTGGGKSLTYQVPGLAQPGLCIVVTPLIALMKDQVDRLRARRIPAVAIHSGLSHWTTASTATSNSSMWLPNGSPPKPSVCAWSA